MKQDDTTQAEQATDILSLVKAHCEIDDQGFGKVMEIFSPGYPECLPSSSNGYGVFKHNSTLAKKYIIRKFYANGTVKIVMGGRHHPASSADLDAPIESYGQHFATLVAWQIYGFAPKRPQKKNVPSTVRKVLSQKPCVFFPLSHDIEVDHKHGREDQNCYPKGAELKDFSNYQPATKHMNDTKRELCGKCKDTNTRFDARGLGYQKGWTLGGERFEPTREGCHGCFLFDPVKFRQDLSAPSIRKKKYS